MKYVGADYHKEFVTICIQGSRGKVQEIFELPATCDGMDELIRKMEGDNWMIMGETSGYSVNLHNYLLANGINSKLVDPANLRLITASDKKTDRNDATVIATFLRLMDKGEISLSISYIVNGDQRDLRDLCRYREIAAKLKGQCHQRISAHMRIHEQHLEDDYDNLHTYKCQLMMRKAFSDDFVLMSLLDDYVYWMNRCDGIDRMFDESVYQTKEVKLLSTIPGIGSLTAVQIMSMIVSIDRFQTADKMRAYFGMAPSVRDSGGKEKHGHITRKGDSMMRSILGRTLNQFIMHAKDSSVMRYYDSHVDSTGKKKARIATMNKILDIIFAVLKRGTPYVYR